MALRPPLPLVLAGAAWAALVLAYGLGFWGVFGGEARPVLLTEAVLLALAALAPPALAWLGLRLHRAAAALEARAAQGPMTGAPDGLAAALVQAARQATAADLAEIRGYLAALDGDRLEALMQALQRAEAAAGAVSAPAEADPSVLSAVLEAVKRLDARQAVAEQALSLLLERRETDAAAVRPAVPARPAQPEPERGQGSLPLADTPPGPIDWTDTVRALNFPRDAGDAEGFRALRAARADRQIADCLQAAEDILTLLSQDGLYMDDLVPAEVPPAVWAAFAGGERGAAVGALGAIRDEAALAQVRRRLKADAVFRDSTLHFLRRFEPVLRRMAAEVGAEAATALAGTRTGRAFMLVARAHGAFD